jgi:predicted transcriptional regulator of viral defense system
MMSKPDHKGLYAVAEGRAGYFTSAEAALSGIGSQLLSHHARSGAYQRAARGIYRLTRFPASRFEDLVIAWLRAGPRSAISHTSALAVYGLSDVVPGQIHVTMPRTGSRRRAGLKLHTAELPESSVTWRDGMRVTTVPRTICDLAFAGFPEDQLRQAVQEAVARGLTDQEGLVAEARKRGRRVARLVEHILAGT